MMNIDAHVANSVGVFLTPSLSRDRRRTMTKALIAETLAAITFAYRQFAFTAQECVVIVQERE